jgi:hypothetical protein
MCSEASTLVNSSLERYKTLQNFHGLLPDAASLLHHYKYPGLHDTRIVIPAITIRLGTTRDEALPPSHISHGQLVAGPFIQPCLDGSIVGWNRGPRMVLLIFFMGFELYKVGTPHTPGDSNTCAVRAG